MRHSHSHSHSSSFLVPVFSISQLSSCSLSRGEIYFDSHFTGIHPMCSWLCVRNTTEEGCGGDSCLVCGSKKAEQETVPERKGWESRHSPQCLLSLPTHTHLKVCSANPLGGSQKITLTPHPSATRRQQRGRGQTPSNTGGKRIPRKSET